MIWKNMYQNDYQNRVEFDLMIFDDDSDYLCYVEAVEMLAKTGKTKECSFIHNPAIYQKLNVLYKVENEEILNKVQKAK